MTQSVDVNALFDRLALLVTGGEPGDSGLTLEARVAALELAVTTLVDHRVADRFDINGNTDRIQIIENQLIITPVSETVNPTPLTMIATSALWDENQDPYKKWDGLLDTSTSFKMDAPEPDGVVFIEFDAGAVVSVKGFIMRFHPDSYRAPQDIVIYSGTSTTGPWTQIGTSDGIPLSSNGIIVPFPSQSVSYFRVVFSNPAGGLLYAEQALLMSWSTFSLTRGNSVNPDGGGTEPEPDFDGTGGEGA